MDCKFISTSSNGQQIMDIVMIGSGNTATILGRKCKAAGHNIVQVLSRNAAAASELAYEWDTESANYITLLNPDAQVYIIAVNDSSISTVASEIRLPEKVIAHTAAAVSKDVLKDCSPHYGVIYPLQSLSTGTQVLPAIPLYYDGSSEKAKNTLAVLASSVSAGRPLIADDEQRMKLHLAAVFVNNFTNHLYVLAEQYCRKSGIDFHQLLPIIEETALRLREHSPSTVQTGPALRQDADTIARHLQLLTEFPHLRKIYELFTDSIQLSAPAVRP
jgi:predicted short-subunit dehydrogenase-like oxidoreductase (DUF2520 family)